MTGYESTLAAVPDLQGTRQGQGEAERKEVMRLQIQQHEELALQHMEAFYCILGQRRELWNSGDEYIAPHDLRFGEACYFLGAAQWSAQLAIWHIEQANNLASPSLWKTTLLASDADYSMDVHWESVDQ